ncbi:MAG: ATP-dependent Clp protease ATP-binding subunit [Polyangiaceae bacterium]|nr:ATP-dependent Clp protease ATP-binding subunit [Polyangiaceae bacterium]
MVNARPHDELSAVCRRAEAHAARRKEVLSTAHLLVALVAEETRVAGVLAAQRAHASALEVALPGALGDAGDAASAAVRSARELSARTRSEHATAAHLLVVLVGDRQLAAYKLLARIGVDIGRVRMEAMQLATGLAPRRIVAAPPSVDARPRPASTSKRAEPARAVSVVPPTRRREAEARPTAQLSLADATPVPVVPRVQARPAAPARARGPEGSAERFALDPKVVPTLCAIGKNLTLAAAAEAESPVIGREAEIERALDVLAKRAANNPVLVGAPGVGKSAVVAGLAFAASRSQAGSADDRVLVELSLPELLASGQGRGALGERFAAILRELAASKGRVALVLEDLPQLFVGAAEDELGADVRLALAKGELPCIGTATPDDYRRAIESDPALARRFSPILVEEPSPGEAREILARAVLPLAKHHRVTFPGEVLDASVEWTSRYLTGRALPDKALSVLDLAGARTARKRGDEVARETLAGVVSELSDVPEERMLETDGARMLALEALLAEDVVGHAPMISRIARVLRRNAAGIRGRRPIGSFLLLGPTGVGKTETAKAIARALFHSRDAMTRVDMSEYAEAHAIARLIGAPPGYVGHEAGGQLTEAVKKRPYQVVLLDEIEKANRDVLEAFLQVLDEGRLTDGRGRTVDFTSTVILMTSNLGADAAVAGPARSIGFGREPAGRVGDPEGVVAAARAALPPELYNRIDEVLSFAPLGEDEVVEIARRLLASLSRTLEAERGVSLDVSPDVPRALAARGGFDVELGARPMKRAIGKWIEGPLAELILRGLLGEGDVARVELDGDGEIAVRAPACAGGSPRLAC